MRRSSYFIRRKDRKTVSVLSDSISHDASGDYAGSESTIYDSIMVSIRPAGPSTIIKTATGEDVVVGATLFSPPLPLLAERHIVREGSTDYEVMAIRRFESHVEADLRERES